MRNTIRKIIEKEIEEYEGNYLSSFLLGYVKSMGLNGRLTKIEIFEIMEEYLITSNNYLENNQISSNATSDPADKEKIKELEKEIKELNKTIELLEKKTLNAKSENWKLKSENFDLLEKFNNTPATSGHNTRGAGRKQKLNNETIEKIKHERKTYGSKLSDLAKKYEISIGLVSKIINN